MKAITRRALLSKAMVLGACGAVVAACSPKIIKETVVVEKSVPEVIKETVIVEKEVAAPAGPAEKKHILFWGTVYGFEAPEAEIARRFNEAHPDIEVEFVEMTGEAFNQKLATSMAVGRGPDIFPTSALEFYRFASKGQLLNVSPYVERDIDLDKYYSQVIDQLRWPMNRQGNFMGIPKSWVFNVLYYNKDLFDAKGISYPDDTWTYDDLRRAANELTEDTTGDGRTDVWGFAAGHLNNVTNSAVWAYDGGMVSEDYRRSVVDSPEHLEAMQLFIDMLMNDKSMAAPGTDMAKQDFGFPGGMVAIMSTGTWSVGPMIKACEFNWDVSICPMGPTGVRKLYGGPNLYCIAATTRCPSETWEFAKALTGTGTGGMLDWYVENMGEIPFNKEIAAELQNRITEPPSFWQVVDDSIPHITNWLMPGYVEIRKAYWDQVDLAFQGKLPLAEALQIAKVEMDKILVDVVEEYGL